MDKFTEEQNQEKSYAEKNVDSGLWIIPFSDFMTILMIFFLALFVIAVSGTNIQNEMFLLKLEESVGQKQSKSKQILEAAGSIENSIALRKLQKDVNVEANAQKIKIIMSSPILFASGSAEITENARPLLDDLAVIFKKIPNKITVEGHTDDIPPSKSCRYKSNLELSGARAYSFIRYIIEKGKLNPNQFVALGYGETAPLVLNDTAINRSKNRRVEISIEK